MVAKLTLVLPFRVCDVHVHAHFLVFVFYLTEAAYRFFKTKSEEDALKRSGKSEVWKVVRRRKERITKVRRVNALSYPSNMFCRDLA